MPARNVGMDTMPNMPAVATRSKRPPARWAEMIPTGTATIIAIPNARIASSRLTGNDRCSRSATGSTGGTRVLPRSRSTTALWSQSRYRMTSGSSRPSSVRTRS